jgi:predicted unusual protein kinase regulating ubiquinone biosynthesis (AarF/ABC1/UbiB family)
VKLAQLFAARADLVSEPYLSALGALADQVPAVPTSEIRRVIHDSYDATPEQLFESFDDAPLAAASLGQVHRARYAGEDVVVKVLRPGVEVLVASDVLVAERLLTIAERWAPNPHVRGLRNAVREFGSRVWEEMDFRREAANSEAMRANFATRSGVAIPRIVPALTRQRVMVMQYMHGTRIDRLQTMVATGRIDAGELVRRVIELYMRMMLVDGLFHADPHPGNLLVQDDGTIVVLDFGMVVPVPRAQRRLLARTAFAGIQRDVEGLVDGFFALGLVEAGADRATMRELVDTLLEVAYAPETTTLDRLHLLADRVMATLYEYPVTLPSDLVYFARTTALIEGLGARYDARFNGATFAAPVALRLRAEIIASLREPGESSLGFLGDEWSAVGAMLGAALGTAVAQAGGFLARLGATVNEVLEGALTKLAEPPPPRDRPALGDGSGAD